MGYGQRLRDARNDSEAPAAREPKRHDLTVLHHPDGSVIVIDGSGARVVVEERLLALEAEIESIARRIHQAEGR
jgi:hypothetical protein